MQQNILCFLTLSLLLLCLQDETYYDAYNNRFGELHGPISFEPYRQAAADFKNTILYKHIAGETQGQWVWVWVWV